MRDAKLGETPAIVTGLAARRHGRRGARYDNRISLILCEIINSGDNVTQQAWNIYLSGEIHTDWRERIMAGARSMELSISFSSPVEDHDASDHCGVNILGQESDAFWRDRKGAGINAIRTSTLINKADAVVVRFGPKYKQWNAAFDAGYAAALNKPLIVLHEEAHDHALKEVDAAANATARTPEQVVEILRYVMLG